MAEATKVCSGCGREKKLRYFSVDRSTKDGYRHRCKQCRRPQRDAINRRYYRRHRDELAAFHGTVRPLINAAALASYRANVEERREYNRQRMREYRAANAAAINARRRENYAAKRAD